MRNLLERIGRLEKRQLDLTGELQAARAELEDLRREINYRHHRALRPDDYEGELRAWFEQWSGTRLDLEGGQDIRKSFIQCSHANSMIFLKKGRLYTCTIAPNIHHLSRFFGEDIRESAADSIDIHEAGSAQELFRFLSEPIPLCRYCLVEKRTFGHPWKRSRREIREWTA